MDNENVSSDPRSGEELIVLRADDGSWYAAPGGELEGARVTDPARLAEVHGHLAADQAGVPATLLSGQALAAYRLDATQAAELEAILGGDATGFRLGEPGTPYYWKSGGDHNTAFISRGTWMDLPGQDVVKIESVYKVPLNLVAERGLILRGPGYGR